MSCLAIIRSARNEMSANEKKLADFILENPSLIRDYSSQQIAGSVGVSQSSVVKFSQKMGYKGFTDLKLAIHESVVKQESNVAVLNGRRASRGASESLKDRLFQAKSDAISGATDLNDDDSLRLAARAIESAARVQLASSGNAFSVVRDTALKLVSIGKPVIAEPDIEVQLQSVATLARGDCLVLISATGQSTHLGQLAKQGKKAGATIISITNQSANPVAALADIRLYSVSHGRDNDIPLVVASTSQQHVMDLVFYTLVQSGKHGQASLSRSLKSQELSKAK
ncbi:MAG TPA: MurR/RpiR family transcriptional regulator [Woeseiaceae bacterium]|nr:MurR/RpiR family transcriptional regulator [Woeseiaceae bacterium]